MHRVKMKDFQRDIHMSANRIRYYMDTGQLDVGIILINQSGKPRYFLFQEKIDECLKNGTLEKLMKQ